MSREEKGDCFEIALHYVMDHQFSDSVTDLKLVHGIVSGHGPLEGKRFEHGWVEHGDFVIEKSNGLDLKVPIDMYYILGNINHDTVCRYDYREMSEMTNEYGTYGPWELPDPKDEDMSGMSERIVIIEIME